MLDYSEALVSKAISELVQGYIMPKPIAKACEFCAYRSVCKLKCKSTPSMRSDEFKIETEDFGGIKW
jgi:ATP-dependent helicase/DNAse subunit B